MTSQKVADSISRRAVGTVPSANSRLPLPSPEFAEALRAFCKGCRRRAVTG